ncbi:MAG: paraquat-inducible protein A [Halieaceae bacterium]
MSAATPGTTAAQAGLVSCHSCGLLTPLTAMAQPCARCGDQLHLRHPNSINRAWALLIAAVIFYIPANLLPITLTTALGRTEGDTIMQGVIYFIGSGEWPIALVIFSASIMVPTLKIGAMTYLLISAQRGLKGQLVNRTKIYRAVELVGRWSMIDVFVVTIMVALVQLGAVASIAAGPGAIYFCAVVVITMLSAESFDPRLIWDGLDANERHE